MKTGRSCTGLILSGCLNLALAALLISLARPPETGRSGSAPNPRPIAPLAQEDLPRSAIAHTEFVADSFHWRALESPNFQVYAANLRAIGCPETTVQDIIIAAVERLYAGRRAPLPLSAGFWSCGPRREVAMKEREQTSAALDREQRDLPLSVLGASGCHQSRHSSRGFIELAIMQFLLGPVADDSAEQVFEAIDRGSALESQIRNQAGGVFLPEDEARLEEVKQQTLAEIQGLLTPAHLEEFAAREAAINLIESRFQELRVTPVELRAIALIRVSVFGALNDIPFPLSRNEDGPDSKRQEFEARLKAFVGDERFAEYLGQGTSQTAGTVKP